MIEKLSETALLRLLSDSERLLLSGTSAEPLVLREALSGRTGDIAHVSALTTFVSGINAFDHPILHASNDSAGFFPPSIPLPHYRQIISTYHAIADHIGRFAPDLAFIPTSLPDARGYVSMGLSAEFTAETLAVSKRVVAFASPEMPRIAHGNQIHVDRFHRVYIDDSAPLSLSPVAAIADASGLEIASNVAKLVNDGATIQFGIGKVPTLVLDRLTAKRKLRIHSGIVTDQIRSLIEAGALDPAYRVTCATIVGSSGFYAWLDGREDFQLRPVSHTHSPRVLAGIDRFMAINSALQVDLFGQVNSEGFGPIPMSAAGGLPDFCSAAHRSRDGGSIIALPSVDSTGKKSRIVARPSETAPITLARSEVDYVVTEYGIADLRGKTACEIAAALVDIAHPDFRPSLARAGP